MKVVLSGHGAQTWDTHICFWLEAEAPIKDGRGRGEGNWGLNDIVELLNPQHRKPAPPLSLIFWELQTHFPVEAWVCPDTGYLLLEALNFAINTDLWPL